MTHRAASREPVCPEATRCATALGRSTRLGRSKRNDLCTSGQDDIGPAITAPEQCQFTPVAGMTGLTAGIARTLLAAPALAGRSRQSVGGWRFGRCCRVLPPQPQLTFQIGDLLFRFGQLPLALRQLLPQTLVVPTKSIQLTFRMSLCLLWQLI